MAEVIWNVKESGANSGLVVEASRTWGDGHASADSRRLPKHDSACRRDHIVQEIFLTKCVEASRGFRERHSGWDAERAASLARARQELHGRLVGHLQ